MKILHSMKLGHKGELKLLQQKAKRFRQGFLVQRNLVITTAFVPKDSGVKTNLPL